MNYQPLLRWLLAAELLLQAAAYGQGRPGGGPGGGLAAMKSAMLPQPTGLATYVQDNTSLLALGKALFWDMQAGSDGHTACASCHFHAGADHRQQNQLSGASATVNYALRMSDFPFHQLSDPTNNRSTVVSDKRQVPGSQGQIHRQFLGLDPSGSTFETGANLATSAAMFERSTFGYRLSPSARATIANGLSLKAKQIAQPYVLKRLRR